MNKRIFSYLLALKQASWKNVDDFVLPPDVISHWLLESGSLSHRLAQSCQSLSVDLVHNSVLESSQVKKDERCLLNNAECLEREVMLMGDGKPWIIARSLIPKPLADGVLSDLGETPLGLTVFGESPVRRDALQTAWVETQDGAMIARRSRLWMAQHPILVAELFLPDSPIYTRSA